MRSLELFLVSVRRSLFPPVDFRKLAFRGGWAGLPIYVVMLFMYPASIAQAGWVDLNKQFNFFEYPNRRHGITGAHLDTLRYGFLEQYLPADGQ